ncbi:MAG: HAD family phosphatase [Candidatus Micrarchaeota archaeon]
MIKGILFDFDGVIVESEPLHLKSFIELLKPFGIKLTKERWYGEFAGSGARNIMSVLFKENHINEDVYFWLKKRADLFLGYAKKGELEPTKGLLAFLHIIREKGILTTVSSSGNRDYISFLLEQLNLLKYFDMLVTVEDVTKNKPDPEIFLVSAKKLGLKPDECLVVEDSKNGVKAGKAAGMAVVCVESPAKIDCKYKIKDFTGFPMDLLSKR